MLCGECRVIDFGAPGASLTELLSKCSPLFLPFPFKVQLMLVGFCERRPGILKTHCFGLVTGDKCHDIADHFSYAGSGCHKWYQSWLAISNSKVKHAWDVVVKGWVSYRKVMCDTVRVRPKHGERLGGDCRVNKQ
ncbi:hypothetical protein YC2023_114119 [Brassica napus]